MKQTRQELPRKINNLPTIELVSEGPSTHLLGFDQFGVEFNRSLQQSDHHGRATGNNRPLKAPVYSTDGSVHMSRKKFEQLSSGGSKVPVRSSTHPKHEMTAGSKEFVDDCSVATCSQEFSSRPRNDPSRHSVKSQLKSLLPPKEVTAVARWRPLNSFPIFTLWSVAINCVTGFIS